MKKGFLSIIFFISSCYCFSQISQEKIDSLKTIVAIGKTHNEKANALNLLIDQYFEFNKDSAEVYIQKTLKYTKNKKELKKVYIHGLLKYAQFYIVKGDYETSASYYDKAWNQINEEFNYDLHTKYYGDLGVLSFYKGDFKSALKNFQKALQLAEDENNEEDQLRFLNNKALAMSYLGNAERSLSVHEKAIQLAEKLKDSASLGKSFNNIGLIYEDMKEYEKALEFYLEALEIKKNGKSKVDIANSLFNIAGMYKEIGEQNNDTLLYNKAEKHYQLAIKKSKEIDYGKVILFSKTGMAQLATVRNKPLKAIEIYKSVVAEAEATKDNQTLRVTYLNLGVNYLKINAFAKAERFFLKALPLIEEAENPSDLASIYKNLSSLYSKQKKYEKAYLYSKKQYETESLLSNNSLEEKISNFEVKYETEKKEKEILAQRAEIAEKELNLNRKNTQLIGLGLVAVLLTILGYLLYNQQKLKNRQLQKEKELSEALVKIETQNRLQEQRLRISRDLHDNIGAQLTFIISSIENLQYGFKITNNKLNTKLMGISAFTKDTIYELRDTIWAMNKNEILLDDLEVRISNFVKKANIHSENTSFKFEVNEAVTNTIEFTSVEGMNIYRIVQEAINNAIKYAEAKHISVSISQENNTLFVTINDDGKGFDKTKTELGNGLNNMKKRAQEIGADFKIESKIKSGTSVRLNIDLS